MSKDELGKLIVIQGVVDGVYTVKEAARRFTLKWAADKATEEAIPGARGKGNDPQKRRETPRQLYIGEKLRRRISALKQSFFYAETNFTHFRKLLEEREHISVSYATLCRMLKAVGIALKRKHRDGGKRFSRWRRRSRFVELLQADATSFDWFGNGERNAFHGFIDDATGNSTALCLCKNECLLGYLEL
ncbi:MAG: hypothetical protein LBF78_02830, partial [Treponema sp.]|nr:hypothetical protein [Treponema sp.]